MIYFLIHKICVLNAFILWMSIAGHAWLHVVYNISKTHNMCVAWKSWNVAVPAWMSLFLTLSLSFCAPWVTAQMFSLTLRRMEWMWIEKESEQERVWLASTIFESLAVFITVLQSIGNNVTDVTLICLPDPNTFSRELTYYITEWLSHR